MTSQAAGAAGKRQPTVAGSLVLQGEGVVAMSGTGEVGATADFETVYREERVNIYRAVLVMTGDPSLAEDSVQEAFARALVRWRRLGSKEWVGGWIARTAINSAKRRLRKPPYIVSSSEPAEASNEAVVDVRRVLGQLPERQRHAVVLYYIADLSLVDVATAMRCSPGTVKAHLSQARSRLRQALEEDYG
jgi:RNA polymerase sigma-70 factor (ECF subfamily)